MFNTALIGRVLLAMALPVPAVGPALSEQSLDKTNDQAAVAAAKTMHHPRPPVSLRLTKSIRADLNSHGPRTVWASLDIDENGRLLKCLVVKSSGLDELDAYVCEMFLRRGQFKAGIDHDGRAKRATVTQSVMFEGDKGPLWPVASP